MTPKQLRKIRGEMTQREMAEELGISTRHYQKLEAGVSPIMPTTEKLVESVKSKKDVGFYSALEAERARLLPALEMASNALIAVQSYGLKLPKPKDLPLRDNVLRAMQEAITAMNDVLVKSKKHG